MRNNAILLCLGGLLFLGGCGYYRITDPATGMVYYTRELKKNDHGAVTFRDSANGSETTLQDPQIKHVSREEYESNRSGNH